MTRTWRQAVRDWWPFSRHRRVLEAQRAVEAAHRSHDRAVRDHRDASAQRAVADAYARQIRDHNAANRYDDWLRQVIQGRNLQ